MAGQLQRLSIVDSINPSFQNYISAEVMRTYRMDLNEFTLEGVLSLHKLREQTGILLYGFLEKAWHCGLQGTKQTI